MEYERIDKKHLKLSSKKLRSMLQKKQVALQNQQLTSQIHHSGCDFENCKDVSIIPETSTSLALVDMTFKDQPDDSGIIDTITAISPLFEFQKAAQRPPFSKPAPSKWDDAQKWIASPTSNKPRTGHTTQARKTSRQQSTNVEEEPVDTKQIDSCQPNDAGLHKFVSWEADPYPPAESYVKPVLVIENSIGQSAINLSRHDSSVSTHSATTVIPPPSTARSVSMRDMGTEMTPIASQEPSRTGTPVRATTPTRSPTSSRPSTPGAAPASPLNDHLDTLLSDQELQMKTRREIMALGTKLGKMNIAAWASKEGEDRYGSSLLKMDKEGQPTTTVTEARAAAWEEAEKAKYMASFKREEIKIQAWENHQQAKTEAKMRKIEMEVEKMRARAQDKLMNKLADLRHRAEEKMTAAEARRNNHALEIETQAEYIRTTGRLPCSFSCCHWCF